MISLGSLNKISLSYHNDTGETLLDTFAYTASLYILQVNFVGMSTVRALPTLGRRGLLPRVTSSGVMVRSIVRELKNYEMIRRGLGYRAKATSEVGAKVTRILLRDLALARGGLTVTSVAILPH